jgi:hypothetical protein
MAYHRPAARMIQKGCRIGRMPEICRKRSVHRGTVSKGLRPVADVFGRARRQEATLRYGCIRTPAPPSRRSIEGRGLYGCSGPSCPAKWGPREGPPRFLQSLEICYDAQCRRLIIAASHHRLRWGAREGPPRILQSSEICYDAQCRRLIIAASHHRLRQTTRSSV